jgi:hypothetical protein
MRQNYCIIIIIIIYLARLCDYFLALLGEWRAPRWKLRLWLLFLSLLSLCCSHALGDTYRRSIYGGLLSLPLTPCLEMTLVRAHVTWAVLRRQTGWGVAFYTGRQCRKLRCWFSWLYFFFLLVGVGGLGRQKNLFGRQYSQGCGAYN